MKLTGNVNWLLGGLWCGRMKPSTRYGVVKRYDPCEQREVTVGGQGRVDCMTPWRWLCLNFGTIKDKEDNPPWNQTSSQEVSSPQNWYMTQPTTFKETFNGKIFSPQNLRLGFRSVLYLTIHNVSTKHSHTVPMGTEPVLCDPRLPGTASNCNSKLSHPFRSAGRLWCCLNYLMESCPL